MTEKKDNRIVELANRLCPKCKYKLEEKAKRIKSAPMMALYALQSCCPQCRREMMRTAREINDK